MNRRMTIAAAAAFVLTGLGAVAGSAMARDCGAPCATLVEYRNTQEGDQGRRYRSPYAHGPGREYYGGRINERAYSVPPSRESREPLSDDQIWAIAKSRVPGRIVNARLHGEAYSFRIISNRGSIVDVVVDRYSGRILSVRGGP